MTTPMTAWWKRQKISSLEFLLNSYHDKKRKAFDYLTEGLLSSETSRNQ
jgi:hypothetical protein